MAAIYEVEITLNADVANDYARWLPRHAADVVAAAGFEKAVLSRVNGGDAIVWVVQYWARDLAQIHEYIDKLAPRFRGEAETLFGAKAQARRRLLDLTEIVEKSHIGANH